MCFETYCKACTDAKKGNALCLVKLEINRALWTAAAWRNDCLGPLLITTDEITIRHQRELLETSEEERYRHHHDARSYTSLTI